MKKSIAIFGTVGFYLAIMAASSFRSRKIFGKAATACLLLLLVASSVATASDIGVYYFPGWDSKSKYWQDLKGLPDSKSPNVPWPDREPLLGYYAEEDIKVAEQHIEWARQYGVTFFAYDWYWDGKSTSLNHAIDNFLNASNNSKLKFSLLWANHSEVPRNLKEFDDMVVYWLKQYLVHPQYYRIHGKLVVFIFSNSQLEVNAKKFGWTSNALLKRADEIAHSVELPGIYFVATTNGKPRDEIESILLGQGYSAYSGWNYVSESRVTKKLNKDGQSGMWFSQTLPTTTNNSDKQ